jgi:hypothetical protein
MRLRVLSLTALFFGCAGEAPQAPTRPPTVRVESQLVVDGGDPRHTLSDPAAVQVTEDGDVYVLDYTAQTLTRFEPEGRPSWVVGGQGEGPGEFMGAAGLVLDAHERPTVWDPRLRRFTQFSAGGAFEATVPRGVNGTLFPWPGRYVDGSLVDWAVSVEDDPPGTVRLTPVSLHSTSSGALVLHPDLTVVRPVRANGRTALPFTKTLSVALDGTGVIWFAETDRYRIYGRTLEGDTVHTFEVAADRRRIQETQRDSAVQASLRLAPEFQVDPDDVPEFEPVILRLVVSGDGRRVIVVPALEGNQPGSVVDLHNPSESRFTRYILPQPLEASPSPVLRGDWLYYVVRDPATDVPSVRRARLDGVGPM